MDRGRELAAVAWVGLRCHLPCSIEGYHYHFWPSAPLPHSHYAAAVPRRRHLNVPRPPPAVPASFPYQRYRYQAQGGPAHVRLQRFDWYTDHSLD